MAVGGTGGGVACGEHVLHGVGLGLGVTVGVGVTVHVGVGVKGGVGVWAFKVEVVFRLSSTRKKQSTATRKQRPSPLSVREVERLGCR